jgi:hypothetical protein
MAIAHQTEVLGAANTTTTNYDISITPAAAINGVVVIIEQNAVTADQITSVSYGITTGAVALSRAASPYGFAVDNTEAGGIYIYWAGDSAAFPSGAQTVRIVKAVAATNTRAAVATMTVAAGKVVALDNGGTSGSVASQANPSWTHASLVNNVMAYLGIHSGLTTMTNTPATNWTLWPATTGFEDMGQQGRGWAKLTSATNTAGSLGAGWTASTADDFVGCSISFKEADPPPGPPAEPPGLLLRSPRPSEQFHLYGPYADRPPSTLLGG